MGLFWHLHGLRGDGAQQVHQDHHRVQVQAAEHREEPDDQAEDDGAGPPGADVGHVPDGRTGRRRGSGRTAAERTQAVLRNHLRCGDGQRAGATRRSLLLAAALEQSFPLWVEALVLQPVLSGEPPMLTEHDKLQLLGLEEPQSFQ